MSVFVGYTKIGQFRNVIQSIVRYEQFDGLDDDGEPVTTIGNDPDGLRSTLGKRIQRGNTLRGFEPHRFRYP